MGIPGESMMGFFYFHLMSQMYNMNPGLEHYTCMVDLLGLAGRYRKRKDIFLKFNTINDVGDKAYGITVKN